MPRTLLHRTNRDSIREFRAAARRRFDDGLALAAAGQRTGAIYLWGYRLPLEDRTAAILRAYDQAEGSEYRESIALASGLTFPEAYATGMLPFQIITAIRSGDPVTLDQCRQAMIDEGASTLLDPNHPQLRFATQEDAEAARNRLVERLPGSAPVWVITQEVGKVEDWAQR